jgi:hypothetical protein
MGHTRETLDALFAEFEFRLPGTWGEYHAPMVTWFMDWVLQNGQIPHLMARVQSLNQEYL